MIPFLTLLKFKKWHFLYQISTLLSDHNHHHHSHHHHYHHNSSRRHSGHIQCYRSKLVVTNSKRSATAASSGAASLTTSPKSIMKNGVGSRQNKSLNNIKAGAAECSTTELNENHGRAKKANPNAVLAKEKKAATQLGVIVGNANVHK